MIERIWDTISNLPAEWQGAIMAFFISIFRVVYDGKEKRPLRITLEALICGGLTLCSSAVIEWLGLPEQISVAVGGAIGFVGVTQLRAVLIKYLKIQTSRD